VKRTITVEIAGTKFKLVADADDAHLQELASMVNERVEKLNASGARGASAAHLLALAALGLADDLRTSQSRLAQVDELTRTAIAGAIARIDQRIAADFGGAEGG
jgi:cell division protein ZapA (FtsZ GTPase activity inhibitor)